MMKTHLHGKMTRPNDHMTRIHITQSRIHSSSWEDDKTERSYDTDSYHTVSDVRSAPALKITSVSIYGDLTSFKSVTGSPNQPLTSTNLQVRLFFQYYHSLHTE